MPPFLRAAILLAALLLALPAGAGEPVVVVNTESGIERLSKEEVTHIFMGRMKRLAPSLVALPVEQTQPQAVRSRFYERLVQKSLPEINAYWARLYFSGQAQPPRQLDTAEEVLELVALNKGAIGVMDGAKVDRRVRVVLDLGK